MQLIHTEDNCHYRRWVNLIPSLLLPGSAQFLSGRRIAGFLWFVLYQVVIGIIVGLLVHPRTPYSFMSQGPVLWFRNTFLLAVICDGFGRPIRCIHLRGWVLFLSVCLALLLLPVLTIRAFFFQPFKMPTGEMQPTIMGNRMGPDGNRILGDDFIINKIIYRFSEPQRGDVIAFSTRGLRNCEQGKSYVKRIAGLPGETICIDPPYLLINGKRVAEPRVFKTISEGKDGYTGFYPATPPPSLQTPLALPSDKITLGKDEYLVLGDNSRNSFDSRYFGPIKRTAILGKVIYICAPADRKRWIE